MVNIPLPPAPPENGRQASAADLEALYRYLYRLADALRRQLNNIEEDSLSDALREAVRQK